MAIATFAAGCFWGVEAIFRQTEGVINTQVGYTGGHSIHPTYEQVCSHTTGHAEAVQIEFDETKISYEELLSLFWKCHNPTQINRQGPDIGSQYRSAIFYHSDEQYKKALASKEQLQHAKIYSTDIATEIVPASIFYKAEEYHQRYFEKHPDLHCHINLNQNK